MQTIQFRLAAVAFDWATDINARQLAGRPKKAISATPRDMAAQGRWVSMDVREWFKKHPRLASASAGTCLIICAGAIAAEAIDSRHGINTKLPNRYFSIDDGKNYFIASSSNFAPFNYQGKTAVRAYVFDCKGRRFVGYLERYTPEALKVEMSGAPVPTSVESYGREIKKPGDSSWVSTDGHDLSGLSRVAKVKCPTGPGEHPTPVEPE